MFLIKIKYWLSESYPKSHKTNDTICVEDILLNLLSSNRILYNRLIHPFDCAVAIVSFSYLYILNGSASIHFTFTLMRKSLKVLMPKNLSYILRIKKIIYKYRTCYCCCYTIMVCAYLLEIDLIACMSTMYS